MRSLRTLLPRKSPLIAAPLMLLLVFSVVASVAADPGGPMRNGKRQKSTPDALQLAPVDRPRAPTSPQHAPANSDVRPSAPLARGGQTDALSDAGAPKTRVAVPTGTSIDMRLLVISADGNEADFLAIKAFLSQIGIPFDALIATQTPLTASMLSDGASHAYYQGIVLCTGNLTYNYPGTKQWQSAFTSDQWTTLWQYEATYGIRQVTSYTYPYGYPDNYGLNLVTYQDTSTTPLQATLTAAGQQVFPYLNAATPVTISGAWTYLATVCTAGGCGCTTNCPTVTPLLTTSNGYVIASTASYPDGRENLAVTAANNPYLFHSMLLSYGIINWVTKGYFLGERHANLNVQPDDILIADSTWDPATLTDTTGATRRMTAADLQAVLNWQNGVRAQPNTSTFRIEWPFVGAGASGIYTPDDLTPAVIANQASFNWISHTYTHQNLDSPTTAFSTTQELQLNDKAATSRLGLTDYFNDSLVQPSVSGLSNPDAFLGLHTFGIKYVVSNTSLPGWNNPSPNAGFYSTYQPGILIIPRHPSNLFYNLATPAQWVSEYNCYYGPAGACANGKWHYWDHNLSYAEILDKESDILLAYLLKWDLDPLMFHQTNMVAYDGVHSLLGDLEDATLAKYNAMVNLPIRNLQQHQVGIFMANRMAYDASGARATWVVGTGVTLTTTNAATIPVTGISYGANTEVYGGQTISYVSMTAGQTLILPLLSK
ncbi:MAG: hypothetical protein U0822_10705 [Anaerolineae bacterium]